MAPASIEGAALSWVLTYALHSSALLGAAWLLARTAARRSLRWREALWKTALAGGVLTASAQLALDLEPVAGRFAFDANRAVQAELETLPPRIDVERATSAPDAPFAVGARSVDEFPSERASALLIAPTLAVLRALAPVPIDPLEGAGESIPARARASSTRDEVRESLAPAPPASAPTPATASSWWRALWPEILLASWIAGGALGLALLTAAWRRLADLVAGRRPLREGALFEQLQTLCRRAGLRHAPRLCVSPHISSPATVGVLRPQICVPARALDELDPVHQEAMLAHELAHVARRDPQWAFLGRLLERALFFQPLNRVARRELAEIAEYRADDWAVRQTGRGLCLARCLAEVAGWIVERRPVVGLLPMATRGSQLGRRIERLLERGASERSHERELLAVPFALGSLALVTLVLPGAAANRDAARVAELDGERERGAHALEGRIEALAADFAAGAEEAELATQSALVPAAARGELAEDVERMVAQLDAEVRELLDEVDALTRTIERNGLEASFEPELLRVHERVRELRAGKERLQRLLPAVLELAGGQADTEHVSAPGTRGASVPPAPEEHGSEERR